MTAMAEAPVRYSARITTPERLRCRDEGDGVFGVQKWDPDSGGSEGYFVENFSLKNPDPPLSCNA